MTSESSVPANGQPAEAAPTLTAADANQVAGPATPMPAENGASSSPLAAAPQPASPSTPLVANPGLIPVGQANNMGTQQAAPATPSTTNGNTATAASTIHLSAGIAVPQSLPTGTQMGMSVDYEIGGRLNPSSRYVWVISSDGAGEIEAEVKLKTRGTLTSFVPRLQPGDRPFQCRIDEVTPGGRRIRVSNVAPLQTSY